MIQRIQSLFLLCTAIVTGLMFFIPVASIPVNNAVCDFYTSKIIQVSPQHQLILWNWPSLILNSLITALALLTIFVRKKSKSVKPTLFLQFRLATVNMVLQLGLFVLLWLLLFRNLPQEITFLGSLHYTHISFIFPVVGIIFTWLAIRGIIKDIALLKSFDRIR
ncbi:MAG: DUF4293 domain-containing protein [Odoribacter sp.]|nr:DUF4293 domain-containing protein [Odoribacter sp.]